MQQKCFQEIADFEEMVKSGNLNIIFMYDESSTPKAPIGGKYAYKSYEEIIKESNLNRNLGIGFPKTINDATFLCVIDIDGDTEFTSDVEEKEEMKIATRRFLFSVIKRKLDQMGLKPMYVKTANNGFHIYLYITQSTGKQHFAKKFAYPEKTTLSNGILARDFLEDFPILHKVANKKMGTKSIEVFTQGAYVVAPGSVINNNKYELLPDGAQTFGEISAYGDKPIQNLLEDILEESFFSMVVSQPTFDDNKYLLNNEKHDLLPRNIKAIGNLMLEGLPLVDGQKHDVILSLGGFLSTMNVSEKSIQDIGNYIIDNKKNPNLFNHDDETERTTGMMTTLLHDSLESDEEKAKRGLGYLKSIFEDKIPSNKLSKILWLNSRPSSHEFLPEGSEAKSFEKVRLDFKRRKIVLYEMKKGKWNSEMEAYDPPSVDKKSTVYHSLDDFIYIDDISSFYESDLIKKKVSFVTTNELEQSHKYIFENTMDMFKQYVTIPGAHSERAKKIIMHITNEYERIGLIEESEGSSRPGIYLSRDCKTMKKFIETEYGIEELKVEAPDPQKLHSALELLTQVNNVYPWEEGKFGVFIKLGLILPYGYIFKQHYNDFFRGIILYGEAGTLKSTAAELIESISVPQHCLKFYEKQYITSGSDLRTEFRIGRALDRHSFPIVVNECEGTFSEVDNRELLKNAISATVIREPGGDNPKLYHSRAIPILTANELPPAVETSAISRRFLVLNFIEKERGDTEEIIERMQFLNENGRRNSRFEEFEIIGDFVFYNLSNHLEYFYGTPEQISENVIRDMAEYADINLDWMLQPNFDNYHQNDREEESQNELEMFLTTLRKPFLEKQARSFSRNLSDETLLESMIGMDYGYIYRVKNTHNDGVLVSPLFKQEVKKRYYDYSKTISSKRLAEMINDQLDLDNEVFYTQNALRCTDGSRKRGVFIDWGDFCKIINIQNNGFDVQGLEDI